MGGGGLLVPLYSSVLGLGPSLAAPVSKATMPRYTPDGDATATREKKNAKIR